MFARIRQSALSTLLISLKILIFRHAFLILHGDTLDILCYGTIKVNENRRIRGKTLILRNEIETAMQGHKPMLNLERGNFQERLNYTVTIALHKAESVRLAVSQNSLLTLFMIPAIHIGNLE